MSKSTPKKIAIGLLSRREHSRAELVTKLKKREFSEEEISGALDELAELGYQSDQRFAESYVRMRVQKGYGLQRIHQELLEREVAPALIEQASSDVLWGDMARLARQKRFGLGVPDEYAERAKQMRFLQYRGFTAEEIRQALFDECCA